MPKLRIAYHRQREREEHALAASSAGPAARDIHLEMSRLHAMLAAKWDTHLAGTVKLVPFLAPTRVWHDNPISTNRG